MENSPSGRDGTHTAAGETGGDGVVTRGKEGRMHLDCHDGFSLKAEVGNDCLYLFIFVETLYLQMFMIYYQVLSSDQCSIETLNDSL